MDRAALETRLRRFSRARRGLLNATLGYRLGLLALIGFTLSLLLLSGWLPNVLVNLGLYAALSLWLVVLSATWLVRRVRFRHPLEEAFHVESLSGDLNSRVISAWDFAHSHAPSPLQRAVIDQAVKDLQREHEQRLDCRERDRRRLRFAGMLAVCVALALTPMFGLGKLFDNFGRSWRGFLDLLYPVEVAVEPGPGQHVYRLGQKVTVAVRLNRPVTGEVKLVEQIGEERREHILTLDDEHRASHVVTSDVESEHVMTFAVGERKIDDLTLIFTTPPTLVNMQTELVYPAYTRLPPRSLESLQQRLLALSGTQITLGFTFSKDLEYAEITWNDGGKPLPLEIVGRYATVSLDHKISRQGTLQVRDKHGFSLDEPVPLEFEVQTDEKPQVFLPRHLKDDMPMLESAAKQFGFGVQASDDYGVTSLILRWQKSTVENPTGVVKPGEVERLISPSLPRAVVSFEKVFEAIELKPGDRISFQVEVKDNRATNPQITLSRRCSFFVYQENLGDLTVRELGFGGQDPLAKERIARSTRATSVKEPEGLRSREAVRNEFEGNVSSGTQAPTVRGEHAQATRDYFRLLSTVKYPEPDPKKP